MVYQLPSELPKTVRVGLSRKVATVDPAFDNAPDFVPAGLDHNGSESVTDGWVGGDLAEHGADDRPEVGLRQAPNA